MNNTTINLSCFIIPNCPQELGEIKRCPHLRASRITKCNYLGIPISDADDELMIEVWIGGLEPEAGKEDNDNLSAHGFGKYYASKLGITAEFEDGRPRTAPSYIPYNVIKNVKEDDVLTFTAANGCKVNLHFEQLKHRYRSHGRFEDVLAAVYAKWQYYYQKTA